MTNYKDHFVPLVLTLLKQIDRTKTPTEDFKELITWETYTLQDAISSFFIIKPYRAIVIDIDNMSITVELHGFTGAYTANYQHDISIGEVFTVTTKEKQDIKIEWKGDLFSSVSAVFKPIEVNNYLNH